MSVVQGPGAPSPPGLKTPSGCWSCALRRPARGLLLQCMLWPQGLPRPCSGRPQSIRRYCQNPGKAKCVQLASWCCLLLPKPALHWCRRYRQPVPIQSCLQLCKKCLVCRQVNGVAIQAAFKTVALQGFQTDSGPFNAQRLARQVECGQQRLIACAA